MAEAEYLYSIPLEAPHNSPKCPDEPWVARQPKYFTIFRNILSGKKFISTDVARTIRMRNKKVDVFNETYSRLYENKQISIVAAVFDYDKYKSMTKIRKTLTSILKKNNLVLYGFVWCKDIGKEKFKNHIHYIFACSKMSKKALIDIFKTIDADGQFLRSEKGMFDYIKKKFIYSSSRSWGHSFKFGKPDNEANETNKDKVVLVINDFKRKLLKIGSKLNETIENSKDKVILIINGVRRKFRKIGSRSKDVFTTESNNST